MLVYCTTSILILFISVLWISLRRTWRCYLIQILDGEPCNLLNWTYTLNRFENLLCEVFTSKPRDIIDYGSVGKNDINLEWSTINSGNDLEVILLK